MERREFIRHSSVFAGGFLLGTESLKGQQAGPLTIAVIGCGDRGNGIMEVMQELPEQFSSKPFAMCLIFRIENVKKILKSEVVVYKDYRRLLDDKSIEAVIIATPLNMHHVIAAAALDAGKHVFLEKTMTYNIPQALSLLKK